MQKRGNTSDMKVETDLKKIKGTAEKKENENWEFRSFLKGYDIVRGSNLRLTFLVFIDKSTEDLTLVLTSSQWPKATSIIGFLLHYILRRG